MENYEPGYQIRPALQEMLDKNVSKDSILDLIRVAQADAIFPEFVPRDKKKKVIKEYNENQERIKKRLQKKGLIKK